ncbi:hypothetical protein KOW79_003380 [Hemibagrus wyckioides]|uniref:Uncharacterized protein n=1 Tax=Hemibagrus wyckioides TaxID=337641 RepID=A0A9D3SS74_9TELE|nr:hypothetical protein KOW79_003380 [Hemibagrus wyckioides]
MNSKQAQSFMDPLPQGKRARLEGTMGTVSASGLSKANSLPQYSQDKSLPYRHTYMSCGQETLDLPSPWSPSTIFVRNRGSPVVHASATEGSITNPIIYRPETVNFPEDNGSPTVPEDVVAKQKLAYNSRSPSKHSPSSTGLISPVPFRKIPLGCRSLSPAPAEKSGGLAIPKPVYGHSPCCAGQKCTLGQSYTMDQGLQRMPRKMFEEDQMMYYGHWTCMQKKESEALLQQRLLAYEHCGERVPLKDVTTEGYHGLSPGKPQRVSAFSDPCQSNYLYNHVHPFVPSSPDHCQRFQMPRQAHKDLAPVYETVPGMQYGTHMRIYQDCPLTSKLDLDESTSPQTKTPKISCLLGSKVREVWMKDEEMARALQKVLYKLENYVQIQECPFPHVIRAGTVFIPMLVVKEVLFPHVQGTFIDQVLQEHRVELRPTTLTEERQLTQLHRRAFSSKLRRLLSLKHLPDIYPDVLNLLYYDCVCKFLDSTPTDDAQKK